MKVEEDIEENAAHSRCFVVIEGWVVVDQVIEEVSWYDRPTKVSD